MGKFPQKVAHASFPQWSLHIVLGQDGSLEKINRNILRNHREESGKAW